MSDAFELPHHQIEAKIPIAESSPNPASATDKARTAAIPMRTQAAHNLAVTLNVDQLQFLIRDDATVFVTAFDEIFTASM